MFCNIMVLPALGGETIKPRWPLPMGAITNLAADRVAGTQIETTDLAGGNINIVGTGQIRTVGGAQKAEAILQYFQHAVPGDVLATLGECFENGEDHVLLAGSRHAFELEFLRDGNQVGGGLLFEFGQIHESSMLEAAGL